MSINLQKRLKEWEEAYNLNNYLHGTIMVAYKGEILLNKGYGMANWEHGVPNTSQTKFRIGSISKSFTAMAIFQLQEQQKLQLEDPINKYLPDFPNGKSITIYQCLTHTSGVTNFTSSSDFWSKTMRLPSSLEEMILSWRNIPLEFEPGTQFNYSNSGYLLLTAIIENITGKNYALYMKENIFNPIGMYHTGCDDGIDIVANAAAGYSYNGKPVHAAYADLSFPLGAYGLYSTTEDLLKWDKAIRSSELISWESTKRMLTSFKSSYACGWFTEPVLEKECYHHFGDISGYVNEMLCFSNDDLTIIFLSNMNVIPVKRLTREIAKIVFGESYVLPKPLIKINVDDVNFICGNYHNEEKTFSLHISKEEEYFVTVPKDYGVLYKFRLVPIKQEMGCVVIFQATMLDETIEIVYANKQVISVHYTDCYNEQRLLSKE